MDWKSTAVGALAAALGTASGAYLTYDNNDRKMDIEMVRISLALLAGKTSDAQGAAGAEIPGDQRPIKKFALDLLERYSGIQTIDKEAWLSSNARPNPEAYVYPISPPGRPQLDCLKLGNESGLPFGRCEP